MEANKPQFLKTAMNYGAITGLVLVVYYLLLYFTGLFLSQAKGFVDIMVMATCILISQKYFRDKEMGGVINYQQTLGFGVLSGVFASIIIGFFYFLEIKFIDPTIIDKQMDLVEQTYLNSGMSEDKVEEMMVMARKMASPALMFISTIFSFSIIAFIISLITSIFIRKEGNPFNQAI